MVKLSDMPPWGRTSLPLPPWVVQERMLRKGWYLAMNRLFDFSPLKLYISPKYRTFFFASFKICKHFLQKRREETLNLEVMPHWAFQDRFCCHQHNWNNEKWWINVLEIQGINNTTSWGASLLFPEKP